MAKLGDTWSSVRGLRKRGGSGRFPASFAGFIAAKRRKEGCLVGSKDVGEGLLKRGGVAEMGMLWGCREGKGWWSF